MKAFIHGVNDNGQDILGTSFPHGGIVTREYKTLKTLIKNTLHYEGFKGKTFHVEAFNNWNHRYGKADIDILVTI